MAQRFYLHINDRSKLDEVVSYNPKTGSTTTRRDELAEGRYLRTDVVLLNGTYSGREYTLHATADGWSGDLWILDILTDENRERVEGIGERMRQNAREWEPAGLLVNRQW